MVEITFTEQNTEKRVKRNEDSLRDIWDLFTLPGSQKEERQRERERT